ncbi:MAG: isocitrate lyase/phosphoenolpyruvate mutase family protein [Nocardioidaceae bacterium]|nr:isocitrate lyase/phosphoenolpyruvate mutase family protein [Nocardioidaceae bacterium]NUS51235.1 isocitrate lyase/phosphoenolpyruvate mutase family protein [Nocardioidaceae bacterium]
MADTDRTHTAARATELLRLHQDPALLTVVNVWDAISAKVVSDIEGTKAIATASHSIAASYGYEDGENIPVDLMVEAVGRIVAATPLPVTADLEGGYGDAAETVRKAIGVGVVGANIEDQMKPLDEAVAQVEAIMKVAEAEGVPDFVLNARTDAFLRALRGDGDPEEVLAEAVRRGRAYLDAGAPTYFVPGILDEDQLRTLVDELGPQRVTTIGIPGNPDNATLERLGVARVSYGPIPQRVALTALAEMVEGIHAGGGVPEDIRPLN